MKSSLLLALAITVATPTLAETLVIPAAQESVEGNEANAFPFGKTAASNEPFRFQQVYDAAGFGEPIEAITIAEIRFRPDSNNQVATPITVQSVEVRLSTTPAAADGLDNDNFDNNIGLDETIVYVGSLMWPKPTQQAAPRPFELPITLDPPFVYDPSAGNLLLEVYNLSTVFPIEYLLDQQNTVGDDTSRVVEVVTGSGEHVIPPVGVGSRGLVTQFVYTVPEPGALGMGVAACFAVATLRRSRAA